MNLIDIHENKSVSAKQLSTAITSKVIALQILANGLLKEHITNTPAVLICVKGEVIYEDERGNKINLTSGDFKEIEPLVKHWVKGIRDSQLILIK
ncbi:quercetin dioxygenase-like cupin family protein [Mesonia hippocampi]|uniref:Quercetin dioxygenase-like cupin family protein n=1 Tax=Mesonia hippocampi TaxID=1628250 RepID=A0A840EVX0_9FLAO|nr:hypothetical protein [Mesonia hippocampi]MBB4118997.1 quercetin dioxygenase-like cupin family protein [Mesonia hippocampi]